MTAALLVVTHSQTGGTAAMTDALLAGARSDEFDAVEVVWRDALDADADDVLESSAIVLGTPENFGYMSGALKHFFDVVYYPCLDATRGRPWSLWVHGNNDVDGAVLAIERIVTGLGWRAVADPLRAIGEPGSAILEAAWELGARTAVALTE